MSVSYEKSGLDELISLAGILASVEDHNVRVHGNNIVVVSTPTKDSPIIYIGSFDLEFPNSRPTRKWVAESVREAGITQPVVWIECVVPSYDVSARFWMMRKLGISVDLKSFEESHPALASLWTIQLMLEYAFDDLLDESYE